MEDVRLIMLHRDFGACREPQQAGNKYKQPKPANKPPIVYPSQRLAP